MPLAARQLIKVHLDSARFRMNKIKLAHAAEFHAFRTPAHPSFFSKIFCSYRRSVLHTLPNTVDNFTDLRSCIEKLARLIQADASHQEKRHQYRYQCPFRRRSRHSVCPVFSRHITTHDFRATINFAIPYSIGDTAMPTAPHLMAKATARIRQRFAGFSVLSTNICYRCNRKTNCPDHCR